MDTRFVDLVSRLLDVELGAIVDRRVLSQFDCCGASRRNFLNDCRVFTAGVVTGSLFLKSVGAFAGVETEKSSGAEERVRQLGCAAERRSATLRPKMLSIHAR